MSEPSKPSLSPADQTLLNRVGAVYGVIKVLMGLNIKITDIIISQATGTDIWIDEPTHEQRYLFENLEAVRSINFNGGTTESAMFRDFHISWEVQADDLGSDDDIEWEELS